MARKAKAPPAFPATEVQAAADALLPLIRRVSPGALEKAEILEQSGMETGEARAAIAWLLEQKKIEETEDGLRIAGAARNGTPVVASGTDGEGEEPREPTPDSPASVPGSGQSYRATFEITATYGSSARDEAAMQQAAAMEEEIADAIHALYPNAVIAVDVAKIEAYKPRVIFDKGSEE